MAYATAAELRAEFNKTSTADDVTLGRLLDAATRAIDRTCNRPDGFVADTEASARVYTGSGGPVQDIDECVEITTVAVKDAADDSTYTEWDATDYEAFGGSADRPNFQPTAHGKPYTALMCSADGDYSTFTSGKYSGRAGFRPSHNVTRGVPTVKVTAKWGYAATCPPDIKEACMMQAARWYKRFESAMADTVGSPDTGTLLYRRKLDPDIEHILIDGRYVRPTLG
jgi:hypothetical protein